MQNITMPGVEHKAVSRDGFQITWQEPPMMGPGWSGNVAPETPHAFASMGRNGSYIAEGRTRDEMLADANRYIDGLLKH
jgi:hypothetical protein